MSSKELPQEAARPVLRPLGVRQLWEGIYGPSGLANLAARARNPMQHVEPYYDSVYVAQHNFSGQESDDRATKRSVIARAVAFGFAEGMDYHNALKDADALGHRLEKLHFEDGSLTVRALYQQIMIRRNKNFAEQALRLSKYAQEDSANLTILLMSRDSNEDRNPDVPSYAFANLEGFYVADDGDEFGPKPGLVLSGKDGMHGKVPAAYHPLGLYIEDTQDRVAAMPDTVRSLTIPRVE